MPSRLIIIIRSQDSMMKVNATPRPPCLPLDKTHDVSSLVRVACF